MRQRFSDVLFMTSFKWRWMKRHTTMIGRLGTFHWTTTCCRLRYKHFEDTKLISKDGRIRSLK